MTRDDMRNSVPQAEVLQSFSSPRQTRKKHARQSASLSEARKLPVLLNIYDLMAPSKLSSFMWLSGLSICHSGVVIHDEEWAFGGHDVDGVTGVYVSRPRAVPDNAIFRTTICIGVTLLDDRQIRKALNKLRLEYTGPSYDLLHRNCNHFSTDVCLALCGTSPPAWVNRIAGLGAKLPLCVSETWVNPPTAEMDEDFEDSARLLPPSEVAPMQRSPVVGDSLSEIDSDDESYNDGYLTEASGGKRLPIGNK